VPAEASNSAPKKISSRPRLVHVGSQLVEREVPEPRVERRREEQRRRRGDARKRGLGDDQPVDPVRMIRRQGVGDRHPRIGPIDREPLVAEHIHQRNEVVREGGCVVAVFGLVR